MGLVRFMTVFDDEEEKVLNESHSNMFDLSSPSTFFRSDGMSYLENFNINSRQFDRMIKDGMEYTVPKIPSGVFQYSLEKIRDVGYLAAFVVCPHGKWTPYYKDAVHAAKNISRTAKRNDDKFFNVNVVNSKAFGIGSVLLANTLAVDFYHHRNNTTIIKDYAKHYAKTSTTYVLTRNRTFLGDTHDFKAYRITDTRVFDVDIGNSVDEAKFDRFADVIGKAVNRAGGKYAVSYGYDCDFIGNVLGRVERDYKYIPIVSSQYGVVSAHLFGTQTLCFHFGEYI